MPKSPTPTKRRRPRRSDRPGYIVIRIPEADLDPEGFVRTARAVNALLDASTDEFDAQYVPPRIPGGDAPNKALSRALDEALAPHAVPGTTEEGEAIAALASDLFGLPA